MPGAERLDLVLVESKMTLVLFIYVFKGDARDFQFSSDNVNLWGLYFA